MSLDDVMERPPATPDPFADLMGERAPISIEWLPLSMMYRDPLVNPRDPASRLSHLKKIAGRFDWNSLRPFVLSKRGKEKYAIVNGAGTREMILRYKPEFADLLYPCIVINQGSGYNNIDIRTKVEATTFGHQGLDAKLQPAQYFHVAAARGVDWVKDIQASLASASFSTAEGGKWPKAVPLPVVLTLYAFDDDTPRLLMKTLLHARAVWNERKVKAVHLMGLAIVLSTYGSKIEEERLRHIMSAMDPTKITAELEDKGGAYTHVYATAYGFAERLVKDYDTDFRKGSLIGGVRKVIGKNQKKYIPQLAALNATFDELLPVWKNAAKRAKDASIED